jgi:hypothetical protein
MASINMFLELLNLMYFELIVELWSVVFCLPNTSFRGVDNLKNSLLTLMKWHLFSELSLAGYEIGNIMALTMLRNWKQSVLGRTTRLGALLTKMDMLSSIQANLKLICATKKWVENFWTMKKTSYEVFRLEEKQR